MAAPMRAMPCRNYRSDFHTHSTASDGLLEPGELVRRAHSNGINVLALTDHETLFGLKSAAAEAEMLGICFIPGTEINAEGHDEVHVLLYGVNDGMTELSALLKAVSEDRKRRGDRFVERFAQLGMPFTKEDLEILPGTDCNRPHVARALVRKGYVPSFKEAFDHFLGVGKPGYVERIRIHLIDLIGMARREGALSVLAHPALVKNQELVSEDALKRLRSAGLNGIEAWHPKQSPQECIHWDQIARKLGMLVTGGSDFHAQGDDHGALGCMMDRWTEMNEDTDKLLDQLHIA